MTTDLSASSNDRFYPHGSVYYLYCCCAIADVHSQHKFINFPTRRLGNVFLYLMSVEFLVVSAEGGICGHLITMSVCLLHISIRDIISPPCECGSETRVPAVATRHTCWSFSNFCLPVFLSVQNICFSEAYSW